MKDAEGMVYVKRPLHVALVKKKLQKDLWIEDLKNPICTQEQMKKEIFGMIEQDSEKWIPKKRLFEEIGGKISDFDVVGTTQDVVSKTGFNIPTGVASIAVVFMAYMTGKKYGN